MKSGAGLCDDCREQWIVFRFIVAEALMEWSGQVVAEVKRRGTRFRF